MNALKKNLGLLWMLMAPTVALFLFWQAFEKIGASSAAARANVSLQWSIILIIFLPICFGLFLFGKYAWHNEYAHLPESSAEVEDDETVL